MKILQMEVTKNELTIYGIFLLFCGYVLSDPLSRTVVSPLEPSEDHLRIRRLETRRLFLLIIPFLWAADFTFLSHTLKLLIFTRGSSDSQSARTSLALRITGSSSQLLTSNLASLLRGELTILVGMDHHTQGLESLMVA